MNLFIFLILNTFSYIFCYNPKYNLLTLNFNEAKEINVSQLVTTVIFYNYLENINEMYGLRLHIESSIGPRNSLLVIIKDDKSVVTSFELFHQNNQSVITAARTICPFLSNVGISMIRNRSLSIEFSSQSIETITANITVNISNNFIINGISEPRNLTITKNSPSYYLYKFQQQETVEINVDSNDEQCMILSVQEPECPIHDILSNVKFNGHYQTVRKKGAMVLEKKHFNGRFVVVFTLGLDDENCEAGNKMKFIEKNIPERVKTFTFSVNKVEGDYILPILCAIGFYLFFYLLFPFISIMYRYFCLKTENNEESEKTIPGNCVIDGSTYYGTIEERADIKTIYDDQNRNYSNEESSSVSINQVVDANESVDSESNCSENLGVIKKYIYVSDLSKKHYALLDRKYFLYLWYVIIISVFYALPVLQLVISYQRTVDVTGNQDICFYNFRCTRPLYIFTAFNNIMSNIGYVLLGILFTLVTWRRHVLYNECKQRSNKKDFNLGIPQYYGLFYAMGVSLTMEGLMSACYHICPSHDNFQFDTAYMYILACLCIIKIYQIRHPDINATAHTFYMIMAFFILIGVVGVVFNVKVFWIIFIILYCLGLIFLTSEVYFMGKWSVDIDIPIRIYQLIMKNKWRVFIPTYHTRMIVVIIFNVFNISFALYGAIEQPQNFSSYFLAIFMMNLLLYFLVYIILKIVYRESIYHLSITYVLTAIVCWVCSIICFFKYPTDWQESPAMSKEHNLPCLLFNFYDIHDIWHFLSSLAMFFSFMALLNVDDSLFFIKRSVIVVF